mmetsp:Transcript_23366/g.38929  ORF Transcript_23366/g.38929 Transcript_23366/m.38929 type:complete len:436 (-) Transcript_23366:317-1624(-)
MAIRCGYTVGRNTAESSLNDQLRIYKPRTLAREEKKSLMNRPANPAHETLSSKCIHVVVENFGIRPVTEVIPPPQMQEITKLLSTDLSPLIGAKYIYNESYWKRCCVDKYGWHNCHLNEHNLLWKQLFFEKLLQETLEDFDAVTEDVEHIYELIDAAMDYIFTLTFRQLPSHIELFEICDMLPNISKIDITYGVKKIGMNYERMLFGMKISDATSLAKIFDHTETLTTVILAGNMIDDDLLRMLMTGLIKNNTITHLDVSHNKITNHGARLLSKLLGENSVLTTLNLSDNQIHAEGGRYLARGLRENDSLLQLNLRLNRLTDEGASLLLEGLRDNVNLIELNLGSNGVGSQGAQILFSILRDPDHSLQVLDISGNELIGEHFEQLRLSMTNNPTLTSLDARRNPGYEEAETAVMELEKIVHANEYRARTSGGQHP